MRAPSMPTVFAAILLLGTLLQGSSLAHAQWKWRDDLGHLHYSDQPPPTSVPAASILTAPRGGAAPAPAGADAPKAGADPSQANPAARTASADTGKRSGAAGADADPAKPSAGPRTWAERSMELRKQDAQRKEEQRKEEELARQAAALGQACEAMRAETRTLESGMRLARVNARGEQEVVSEEARAARLNALRKDLQAHCPTS